MTAAVKIPDINGIIDSIYDEGKSQNEEELKVTKPAHPDIITNDIPRETLWNSFKVVLNEDPKIVGRRSVFIDNDLLDTIDQCDFEGLPRVTIVNAILRAFLQANVEQLHNIRKKKLYDTLLDQYDRTTFSKT